MTMRDEIGAVNDAFVAAINRGDATSISALYTSDCSVLVPNHTTLKGRDEVHNFFGEMIDAVGGTTTLEIVELSDAGDWAYQWLHYTLEAESMSDSGRVVEILERQADGSWKIRLSIFNSELASND
jgi:uncharacterized protein (TIGR02246 family)